MVAAVSAGKSSTAIGVHFALRAPPDREPGRCRSRSPSFRIETFTLAERAFREPGRPDHCTSGDAFGAEQ